MFLTPAELYRVLDAAGESTLDQRFIELYESDGRNRFNRTVRDMLSSRVITPWKPLVRQSASAYRRGHFAVTIPALLTILKAC